MKFNLLLRLINIFITPIDRIINNLTVERLEMIQNRIESIEVMNGIFCIVLDSYKMYRRRRQRMNRIKQIENKIAEMKKNKRKSDFDDSSMDSKEIEHFEPKMNVCNSRINRNRENFNVDTTNTIIPNEKSIINEIGYFKNRIYMLDAIISNAL